MLESMRRPQLNWLAVVMLAAAPVILASILGNLATMPQINGWYAGLTKPAFNPPNWIFGPVWTLLFIMMGYAFYRILRLPAETPGKGLAIILFLLQLVLNVSWSFAFFASRSPAAGIVVIAGMWLAIAATILAFRRLDGISSALLLPYLAWVAFAAVLNIAIWRLNF